MANPGIDPGTFRTLSGRSTISANSPATGMYYPSKCSNYLLVLYFAAFIIDYEQSSYFSQILRASGNE